MSRKTKKRNRQRTKKLDEIIEGHATQLRQLGITKKTSGGQVTFVGEVALWICPKCRTKNPLNIAKQNCKKCGKRCPIIGVSFI